MREHLRQATLTAAVCVLAIAAYTTIRGGSDTAAARTASAPSGSALHVTGAATVRLKPDRATISFTTHGRGPTLAAAQNRSSRAMRAVIAAMTAGGVAGRDMQTHHQYATRAGRHVAGYVAEQSLTVTVRDISRAGKLDAAGVSAGAHSSEGPVFRPRQQAAGLPRGAGRSGQAGPLAGGGDGGGGRVAHYWGGVDPGGSERPLRGVRRRLRGCAGTGPGRGRSHPTRAQPGERLGDGGVRRRAGRLINRR
jgi:hypothetical protein